MEAGCSGGSSGAEARHVVTGHQSFQFQLPGGVRASFTWAPYAANITEYIQGWCVRAPPSALPERGAGLHSSVGRGAKAG